MRRTRLLLTLLVILGCMSLLGCPSDGGLLANDDDSTVNGADDDDSTSEPPPPTVSSPISIMTSDGLELRGSWQPAPGVTSGPAVLLLHELWGDRGDFTLIWDVFQNAGISTMAFDFRGHGNSADASVDNDTLRTSPGLLEADVRAALDELLQKSEVDPSKIGILGLDVGANLAVLGRHASRQGSNDPWGVDVICAVSPDLGGVEALGQIQADALVLSYAQYVAGENAPEDAEDATALYDVTADPRDLRVVLGTEAHGAAMLTGSSDARTGIVNWFSNQFE